MSKEHFKKDEVLELKVHGSKMRQSQVDVWGHDDKRTLEEFTSNLDYTITPKPNSVTS